MTRNRADRQAARAQIFTGILTFPPEQVARAHCRIIIAFFYLTGLGMVFIHSSYASVTVATGSRDS